MQHKCYSCFMTISKGMFRNRIWTRRFLSGFGSAKDSMERLKYLASIGSEGIEVVNDYPTQVGIDGDHPMAVDEAGLVGIPVSSLDDVETILEGFPLDKTTITFESSGASSPVLPCMYFAMAQKQGVPFSALNAAVQLLIYTASITAVSLLPSLLICGQK
ncbi:MAG: methylmalonyl-CoA mutase family protein [Desulfobacterales bacterium]